MKKKIISLLFVTVLGASMLVGCGGDTLEAGNAEITQEEETETNFQREQEVTSVNEETDTDSETSEAE